VKPLRGHRLLFAAFVVLALAAIYGVAGMHHRVPVGGYAAASSGRATVTSAVKACAAPGTSGVTAGGLAIAAMPGSASVGSAVASRFVPGGSAAPGSAVATVNRPAELQVVPVKAAPALPKALLASQPGSSAAVSTQNGRGGALVTATGAMAQGLAVDQTGPGGMPTAECDSPSTSFWFVGPGQASAADVELYLMNTDDQAADVQVTVITDVTKGGPVLGNADNGISVPPHSMVTQSLGALLKSSKVMAINVSTSVGRVVAALRESRKKTAPGGWLPATQAPARSQMIPALPRSSGKRELYIAVPGAATAEVKVTAVTSRGSYQPTGGTGIELLGGSAAQIPLPALGGVPGALKISSSVPVAVSLLAGGGPAGTPGAVAASAVPIQEQSVFAASPVGSAGSTYLVLSAPKQAASVRVVVATASQPATGQTGSVVHVPAKGSVVVPVKSPRGHRVLQVMVVVTPLSGSGPVYAGQVINHGGIVLTVMPAQSSLTSIPLPVVHGSLAAVTP